MSKENYPPPNPHGIVYLSAFLVVFAANFPENFFFFSPFSYAVMWKCVRDEDKGEWRHR